MARLTLCRTQFKKAGILGKARDVFVDATFVTCVFDLTGGV